MDLGAKVGAAAGRPILKSGELPQAPAFLETAYCDGVCRGLRWLPVLQLGVSGRAYFPKGDKLRLRGQVICVSGRARQVRVFAQRHPKRASSI